MEQVAAHRVSGRLRRNAVRGLAVLGAFPYSLLLVLVAAEAGGLVTSSPVGSPADPPPSREALIGAAAPGETVHLVGALTGLALGLSGLLHLVLRPERPAAARHVLGAAGGMLVVVPLVGNPDNVGGQAGLVDPAFLVLPLLPLAAGLLARPFREVHPDRSLALLAAGALPVGGWWGIDQALMQRNTFPPAADPHHQSHWFGMAVVAFGLCLVVVAAALGGRGREVAATAAGLAAVALGLSSSVVPDAASAVPLPWALLAVTWGVTVLVVTWRRRRPHAPGTAAGGREESRAPGP